MSTDIEAGCATRSPPAPTSYDRRTSRRWPRSSSCGRGGSRRGCCSPPPPSSCSSSASSSGSRRPRALRPARAGAGRPTVELELPADIGRDWKADDTPTPARLDLDGDGTKEKVDVPRREDQGVDGRTRLADHAERHRRGGVRHRRARHHHRHQRPRADRRRRRRRPGAGALPTETRTAARAATRSSSTCATVCSSRRSSEEPELLVQMGDVPVPGSETEYYDLVRARLRGSRTARSAPAGR